MKTLPLFLDLDLNQDHPERAEVPAKVVVKAEVRAAVEAVAEVAK